MSHEDRTCQAPGCGKRTYDTFCRLHRAKQTTVPVVPIAAEPTQTQPGDAIQVPAAERPWYHEFDWASLDQRRLDEHGHPVGVRPKYCEVERMRRLLSAIESGLYPADAAVVAGIHRDTFWEWRADVPTVANAIRDAESFAKGVLMANIRGHMQTNWQASAWMAERRWPAEYGRRDRIAHTVEGVVGLQVMPAQMSEAAILKAAELEEELSAADELEQLALPAHGD